MSTPKPPGKGKPFLADDDLLNELDAWDATFDALHGTAEAAAEAAAAEAAAEATAQMAAEPAPSDWSAAESADAAAVGDSTQQNVVADLKRRASFDDLEIDAQMTIDSVVPEPRERTFPSPSTIPDTVDLGEADFSEIGLDEPGLGPSGPGSAAPPASERFGTNPGIGIEPHTKIRRANKTAPPVVQDDDDAVYTSASRPHRAPAASDLDEDPIAPPPKPKLPVEVRRGPAIIRRVTAGEASAPKPKDVTPPHGVAALGDETVVASFEVMQSGRSQKKTAPPPLEEDDYADIEIGASEPSEPSAATPEPVVRRTAHVVRRDVAATRTPVPPIRPVEVVVASDSARSSSAPAKQPGGPRARRPISRISRVRHSTSTSSTSNPLPSRRNPRATSPMSRLRWVPRTTSTFRSSRTRHLPASARRG